MDLKETSTAIRELVLPELKKINNTLILTNKRLDDLNLHLADQSRRIDETNKPLDEVSSKLIGKVEAARSELSSRIDATNTRINTSPLI